MTTTRTVYLEESRTPIYRRIAHALGVELTRSGLEVMLVKPDGFNSVSFQQFLLKQSGAAYVTNAASNIIQSKQPGKDEYFFENFPGKMVFLHQDAILGGLNLLSGISKLQAWQRVAERSAHLCIEADNIGDLASVGIHHARLVPHASEVPATEPSLDGFEYGASFVGHAVPSMYYQPTGNSPRFRQLMDDAVQARRQDFAAKLEPSVKAYSEQALDGLGDANDQAVLRVAQAQWLRNQITGQSMPLRGWVFEQCGIAPLDIFGGDPAYLHGVARNLQVERPGVRYHPAVYEPADVQRVFNKSKVSINVSSLQFDHAVVNRFHDVIMSGGLCLTDARDGLPELTSAHADLSYRTLDELRDRAEYFSKPENAKARAAVIKQVQQDVARNSGYAILAREIAQSLNEL